MMITAIFGTNAWLATVLMAMLPLIELKGAIPMGMSTDFWGVHALSTWQAFGWALLGSSLVVPVVALIFMPIYNWLCTKKFFKKILDFIVGDVARRSEKVKSEAAAQSVSRRLCLKVLAVLLFVTFPVPLTGVWTGTCFAVLLGLNFWVTCATVCAGNALCGVIVTFVCQVFPQATQILLFVFLGLIVVAVLAKVLLHIIKNKKAAVAAQTTVTVVPSSDQTVTVAAPQTAASVAPITDGQ